MDPNQNANPVTVEVQPDPADVTKNKVFAILSYFGILFILPLLCCKNSSYAKFHANQGLLLFIIEVVAGVLNIIPILGNILSAVLYLVVLVFFILGVVSAAQGTMKPLPLIGSFRILQ